MMWYKAENGASGTSTAMSTRVGMGARAEAGTRSGTEARTGKRIETRVERGERLETYEVVIEVEQKTREGGRR